MGEGVPTSEGQKLTLKDIKLFPEKTELIDGELLWSEDEKQAVVLAILKNSGLVFLLENLPEPSMKELRLLLDDRFEMITAKIESDFALALVYFSKGELTPPEARELGREALSKIDINNKVVAHKGLNSLAKLVLERRVKN